MDEIALLLDRFLDFKNNGQNKYFDSEDIISLIEYFTETNDVENLQVAIDLGYELHPDNLEFKLQICKMLVNFGDHETALKLLEDIEIEDDKDADFLYIECLLELGMKDDALEFLALLAENGSHYLEDAIAHTACVLNDIDEYVYFAYDFIVDYLEEYPDNESLKIELCFNLELQGRIKEAMDKCKELLQANSYSAELWFMKGRLYATYCDYGNAVESLDYALSCCIENEEMKYEIMMLKANCFRKNENYYSAIEVYEEIFDSEYADKNTVISHISECLICAEEFDRAYEILKENLKSDDFENFVTNLGYFIFCCIMTDRRNEAMEILCDTLMAMPRDVIMEKMKSMVTFKSDFNKHEEVTEEERQELISSFINSNLHVN